VIEGERVRRFVDLSTTCRSWPSASSRAQGKDTRADRCPVRAASTGASKGTLALMASGPARRSPRSDPALPRRRCFHRRAACAGHKTMKLCNNFLSAAAMTASLGGDGDLGSRRDSPRISAGGDQFRNAAIPRPRTSSGARAAPYLQSRLHRRTDDQDLKRVSAKSGARVPMHGCEAGHSGPVHTPATRTGRTRSHHRGAGGRRRAVVEVRAPLASARSLSDAACSGFAAAHAPRALDLRPVCGSLDVEDE